MHFSTSFFDSKHWRNWTTAFQLSCFAFCFRLFSSSVSPKVCLEVGLSFVNWLITLRMLCALRSPCSISSFTTPSRPKMNKESHYMLLVLIIALIALTRLKNTFKITLYHDNQLTLAGTSNIGSFRYLGNNHFPYWHQLFPF